MICFQGKCIDMWWFQKHLFSAATAIIKRVWSPDQILGDNRDDDFFTNQKLIDLRHKPNK